MASDRVAVTVHHRRNDDGTTDSICPICYRTIARESDPANLIAMEQTHVCEDRFLSKG
jgi:hypothetical protein